MISLQTMLSFIFKKTLLALTIPFPLPIAMLMAGYWIEHLTDLVCRRHHTWLAAATVSVPVSQRI
jgi:hypothetical protein